jgi:hypothetical protein
MFSSIIDSAGITFTDALLCTAVSLVLGLAVSLVNLAQGRATKSLSVSLVLLPAIVQTVIMMVNGNLGVGVAVMGAFSIIRFRTIPGGAKEIVSVFFAMAIGLATGTGYLTFAALFTAIVCAAMLILYKTKFGEIKSKEKHLKIVIPEDLDYTDVFDDIFKKYTRSAVLVKVKTTNMGSMFELTYELVEKPGIREKAMLDELRCRNGNLSIVCGTKQTVQEEL